MSRRVTKLFLMTALVIGFQGIMAKTASAHFPLISATASCNNKNVAVISFTATSWDPTNSFAPGSGSNAEIEILFNGFVVDTGAFTLNKGNMFSGTAPAPSTSTVTVEALAVDAWGDGAAGGEYATTSVTIPTDCAATGRFTGGGKQVDLATGTTITKGLELDCDLMGSNNLEINWSNATGTHQFHLEDFIQAVCFLNPAFSPTPPVAPINTMHGVGTGRYDNVDGFTVLFSLEDHGEPGGNDKACFRIYTTAPADVLTTSCEAETTPGNILDFPLSTIVKGNLQAHPDQH